MKQPVTMQKGGKTWVLRDPAHIDAFRAQGWEEAPPPPPKAKKKG